MFVIGLFYVYLCLTLLTLPFTSFVSLSVIRGGRFQPNLLCSIRGNGGNNWEVYRQRLRPGSSSPFSSRPCPRSQGLWDEWKSDFKALKGLSGWRRCDNGKGFKFQPVTELFEWSLLSNVSLKSTGERFRTVITGNWKTIELTCFQWEAQVNHVLAKLCCFSLMWSKEGNRYAQSLSTTSNNNNNNRSYVGGSTNDSRETHWLW